MPFDLPLPDNFNRYPQHLKDEVMEYLNEFDELDKEAYMVAYTILKTGFNIAKSNGFLEWKKEQEKEKERLEKEKAEQEPIAAIQNPNKPLIKKVIKLTKVKKLNN